MSRPRSRPLPPATPVVALGLMLVVASTVAVAVAVAATRNGVTVLAPKDGGGIPMGKAHTFVVRARGGGEVFVHVCRSDAKRADGLICTSEAVGRARRGRDGLYRFRAPVYDYPEHWLNRPGVYYWQAHRIRCERRRTRDCRQEGPVSDVKIG